MMYSYSAVSAEKYKRRQIQEIGKFRMERNKEGIVPYAPPLHFFMKRIQVSPRRSKTLDALQLSCKHMDKDERIRQEILDSRKGQIQDGEGGMRVRRG